MKQKSMKSSQNSFHTLICVCSLNLLCRNSWTLHILLHHLKGTKDHGLKKSQISTIHSISHFLLRYCLHIWVLEKKTLPICVWTIVMTNAVPITIAFILDTTRQFLLYAVFNCVLVWNGISISFWNMILQTLSYYMYLQTIVLLFKTIVKCISTSLMSPDLKEACM